MFDFEDVSYRHYLSYLNFFNSSLQTFRPAVENVEITCQKLFYDDHTVVNSLSDTKSDMMFGNYLKKLCLYILKLELIISQSFV